MARASVLLLAVVVACACVVSVSAAYNKAAKKDGSDRLGRTFPRQKPTGDQGKSCDACLDKNPVSREYECKRMDWGRWCEKNCFRKELLGVCTTDERLEDSVMWSKSHGRETLWECPNMDAKSEAECIPPQRDDPDRPRALWACVWEAEMSRYPKEFECLPRLAAEDDDD
eukprot:gnl/Hemi2/16205_TR5390_c0_g1_i1.p1 gnl/Hemi2/16205_TR5390_c0_g1~~gnl/Hemi2/16205_TR5390_c0_g1_i1.p1  ORF type:complete len:180 (+),score=55.93 gnl/Hemi2/16205_TR5390_c0_g1_i1:32-541(+)